MLRISAIIGLAMLATACTDPVVSPVAPPPPDPVPAAAPASEAEDELTTLRATRRAFAEVTRRLEPVAESECRRRAPGVNCDFRIIVDSRPGIPPNAFQTLDDNNRPVIIFTIALLKDAKNADEIAFVMGHEAAHHIEGHLARRDENAALGAIIFAGIASSLGGNVESASELGAAVGARSYSKDFELEADALGTVITARAGYAPIRGAEFFNRIPDPGDRFLGTHPPNAQRLATVRRVAAGL